MAYQLEENMVHVTDMMKDERVAIVIDGTTYQIGRQRFMLHDEIFGFYMNPNGVFKLVNVHSVIGRQLKQAIFDGIGSPVFPKIK